MQLRVLGSGSAFRGAGWNAGYCLDGRLLVDCGAPLQTLPRAGIELAGIDVLLLTHFHFDHCSQAPLLLGARALECGEPRPLILAGPPGTREYLMRLLRTGYGGQLHSLIAERLPLRDAVLQDGCDVEVAGFRIRAASVVHSLGPSLAYAITGEDGATVGFSGDTTLCAGLERIIEISDLMVCECTGFDERVPSHLWAEEVAGLIERHRSTRFLLSHLRERRGLDGALVAHDLLGLDVRPPGAELPAPPPSLARESA